MNPGDYDVKEGTWNVHVPGQEWYSVQDVSIILGVGGPSVYSAINRGSLVAYKVSGATRIKHDDLLGYITKRAGNTARTSSVDQLITRIVPGATQTAGAQAMATGVAHETGHQPKPAGPNVQLDLFDEDDEDDDPEVG